MLLAQTRGADLLFQCIYKLQTCLYTDVTFPFQSGGQPWQVAREQRENLPNEEQRESSSISDVETELFIGLPETRTKRLPISN